MGNNTNYLRIYDTKCKVMKKNNRYEQNSFKTVKIGIIFFFIALISFAIIITHITA